MIEQVNAEQRITVMLESEPVEISGYVGQYRTIVSNAGGDRTELVHGVVIVASGGQEITPTSYGYGKLPGVLTQRELEQALQGPPQGTDELLSRNGKSLQTITMIQCVGSRDEDHPYCSRVCCSQAMKNALEIKRRSPSTRVVIFYRDLRSYGFRERLYREARRAGVVFLKFDADRPPAISDLPGDDGKLRVQAVLEPEGKLIQLDTDLVVLSAGIEADPGNETLSQLLKLPLTSEGFFLEAHVKLRPVDFAADGVFLCGLAHSPRAVDETIAQAQAASVRAVALLAKKELTATPIIASVNPRLCSACGLCVEICPYGARRLEAGMAYAEVVDVLCQGCGACVVACPNKASQQKGFEFSQISAMLEAALSEL
jgi:heterodisulfide reductase subunit A2